MSGDSVGATMSIMGRLANKSHRLLSLAELDAAMDRMSYGIPTASGSYVSVESSLQTSAVWACVGLISESLATSPCMMFNISKDGTKTKNQDHPLYYVIHDQWNDEMTATEGWQTAIIHALTWGNSYNQIVRDSNQIRQLWPLTPSDVRPWREPDGRLCFRYKWGTTGQRLFEFSEIFHFKGRSLDGIVGLSPIAYARQTIGLALTAEEYGGRFFGNGSTPGGVLQTDGKLTDEAALRLQADWEKSHAGVANSNRVAILEEGLKWVATTIPNEDSQWLETRQFSIQDIARWYRVPPHKLGIIEHGATNHNIEHQAIEFVTDTIRPWAYRIQQAISRDLISIAPSNRNNVAEFQLEGLLRGDLKTRYDSYAVGRQWGWLSADDIRETEGMNPLPGTQGDNYLVPLNMVPADQIPLVPPDTTKNPPVPPGGTAQSDSAPNK